MLPEMLYHRNLAAYEYLFYGKDHDMSKKKYHPNDTIPL